MELFTNDFLTDFCNHKKQLDLGQTITEYKVNFYGTVSILWKNLKENSSGIIRSDLVEMMSFLYLKIQEKN